MEFRRLGQTGLMVSRLSFGTGALAGLTPRVGGELLVKAFGIGANLWDGSSDYGTYAHMRYALKHIPREQVIIVTKTYAENDDQTERDVATALRKLGTDYIDILLLHYTRPEWLGQPPRLPVSILDQKKLRRVRALGISTHSVATVRLAAEMPEVQVVETVVNQGGRFNASDGTIGEIEDGTSLEMLSALKIIRSAGRGVIAMKVLGSGILRDAPTAAIHWVAALSEVDTMCIGMRSLQEIETDARIIMGTER